MSGPFSLTELFSDFGTLTIVDVGALMTGENNEAYRALLDSGRARVIGFEPDAAECEKLNRTRGAPHRFFPHFIGDGADATYYETNRTMTGSLYPPNDALLGKFQNMLELTELQREVPVATKRLDEIEEIDDLDFLKIDVQGSELMAFRGAERLLAQTMVVQTEVCFVPLYIDQPLFADIDIHLRAAGLQFHTFLGFGSRCLKPLTRDGNPNRGINQRLWSDAVYVRDFLRLNEFSEAKLLKLAVILNDVFQSFDFVHFVLAELDRRDSGGRAQKFLERLMRA